MGVKYIAIMGFGYSGSTAFADTLLPYKQFESIQDYEEINELRGPDSLIKKFKIYKSAQKKEKILAQFLLVSFIRLVRRFVWGFRKSIFIRNGLSWRRKFGNNIKRLRCDINYIRCILWFRKASVTADVEDLIRIYLIGLRISCKVKVDQTLILNQISFPEHPKIGRASCRERV